MIAKHYNKSLWSGVGVDRRGGGEYHFYLNQDNDWCMAVNKMIIN
jgi:hypothetical protein